MPQTMGVSRDLIPTTGRPGRAVLAEAAAPAHPPTGYEPTALDGALLKYLAVAEKTIRHAESLAGRVEKALRALELRHEAQDDSVGTLETALSEADQLTILFDRMAKAGLNIVKAVDELSRLRSFIAGGPDSRPDLTIKGELELRAIVLQAVQSLGIRGENSAA